MRSVYFSDDNTGLAVGDRGKILSTTDGGRSLLLAGFEGNSLLCRARNLLPLQGYEEEFTLLPLGEDVNFVSSASELYPPQWIGRQWCSAGRR